MSALKGIVAAVAIVSACAGGEPAIAQILMQTHAGMTTDEFNAIVTAWGSSTSSSSSRRHSGWRGNLS